MVALVRAGVTGTCSWPQRPRYGHLTVDSNLPDVRIALGSPAQNEFTAAVLDAAGPEYADELDAGLRATGTATVWVPAGKALTESWTPGADLRDVRALPVLIVAGRDDGALAEAVARLAEDLADARIEVDQNAPAGPDPAYEGRTVALLNRGVPGFAVDSDGTLHASLLRSCTGWPSGTWIDPPRRTAPDGSNFQLQHWTHRFEYALCSGDGDWRQAGVATASAEFSNPLMAVPTGTHEGRLPGRGSLLRVEPAGSVALGALKPAGNPLASGDARPVDPAAALTVRLVERHGVDTTVVVHSPLGDLTATAVADLLERPVPGAPENPTSRAVGNPVPGDHGSPVPRDGESLVPGDRESPISSTVRSTGQDRGRLRVPLRGFEIATVLARPDLPSLAPPSSDANLGHEAENLAPEAETALPLYARYWLHNRGPAPLGGLPAAPYLHPARGIVEPVEQFTLRITVASDRTDGELAGTVRLLGPDGWTITPAELPVRVPAGGHAETELMLHPPRDAAPGLYPIRAQLAPSGDDLPPSWRQIVEDVCVLTVPGRDTERLLRLVREPRPVSLRPGQAGQVSVVVATDGHGDLAAEAHLISPWGTWEWTGPAATGALIPARGQVEIAFDLMPPPWAEPGQWWALVRVAAAGELLYSPTVPIRIKP
jgi:hypothetical protein